MAGSLNLPLFIVGGIAVYEAALIFTGTKPLLTPDPIYDFLKGMLTGPCGDYTCEVGEIKRGKPFCDCKSNPCGCDQGWYVLLDGTVKCVDMGRPEMICGSDQIKRGPPHCDCITIERWEHTYKVCENIPDYTQQELIDLGVDVVEYVVVPVNYTNIAPCQTCGCLIKTLSVGIDVGDIVGADVLQTLGFFKVG